MSDFILQSIQQFEFIRPIWGLLGLIIIPFIGLRISLQNQQNAWAKIIDAHLLKFMLNSSGQSKKSNGLILPILAIVLMTIGLMGPSFSKQHTPVFATEDARVIVLDLSFSMDAIDVKPTRLTRAKHKLQDLLDLTKEGETALIVYAGDAFVISPLTSDANTIKTMVPVLSTGIMPIFGSEPRLAIEKAIELLTNANKLTGQIIWITDGIDEFQADEVIELLKPTSFHLSILAVGTEQGAPISLNNEEGFLKDEFGQIVMPTFRLKPFQTITTQIPADIARLSAGSDDISGLLRKAEKIDTNSNEEKQIEDKNDQGYIFVIPAILLMLILFRKNAQFPGLSFAFLLVFASPSSDAGIWDDLWQTKDQQAQKAFNNNQHTKAAELFKQKDWQAAAQYKAQNYTEAEKKYAQDQSSTGHYNRGNSLALQSKYDEAIKAYEQALAIDPDFSDAQFNKELIEQLKEQQQQDQQNEQDNDEQQQQDQQNQQQNQQQEQQSEQQNEQQQQQDQQAQQEQQEQQEQQQKELSEEELQDLRDEQEKQQALEQWLQQIPDEPGGLLRRKMYREYQKRGRENRYTKKVW